MAAMAPIGSDSDCEGYKKHYVTDQSCSPHSEIEEDAAEETAAVVHCQNVQSLSATATGGLEGR